MIGSFEYSYQIAQSKIVRIGWDSSTNNRFPCINLWKITLRIWKITFVIRNERDKLKLDLERKRKKKQTRKKNVHDAMF